MNLYFLRHGSAGKSRVNPVLDRKRPLDVEGKQQCRLVAQLLNALDVQMDVVLSSPLKRALQTASMVANEIGYDSPVVVARELAPGGAVSDFRLMLASHSRSDNVLVVGHNPSIARYVSAMVSPDGTAGIRMRKGGLAKVDTTTRPATLQWLVDPRVLTRAYASTTKKPKKKK